MSVYMLPYIAKRWGDFWEAHLSFPIDVIKYTRTRATKGRHGLPWLTVQGSRTIMYRKITWQELEAIGHLTSTTRKQSTFFIQ